MKLSVDGIPFDVAVSGDEVTVGDRTFRVRVEGRGPGKTVFVDEQPFRVMTEGGAGDDQQVLVDAQYHTVRAERGSGLRATARPAQPRPAAQPAASNVPGGVPAAMAGRVLKLNVEPGQAVKTGDVLLIFEAMKMENEIRSPQDGTVKQIAVKVGDRVSGGDLLLVLE
ncbi:MAG: biotin/lipoyl-containing protein [Dehalococcoidia bacterium]